MHCIFLCYVITLISVGCLHQSQAEFVSENFTVKWRTWNDSITFYIVAKTHGWVAIGFNDQPQMKGADLVLAGVANNSGYIYDLHDPKGHTRPLLDSQQDYKLIWAQENDTYTFITIRRPINTLDVNDHVINNKPISLLWAYNEKDAKSGKDFAYHGPDNRGVKKVTLLKPETEMKIFKIKPADRIKAHKSKNP